MSITNPSMWIDAARKVCEWSVRDVLDYLGEHYAEVLEYPPDADSDTMRVCDDENRARAVVYMAGCALMPTTLDAANRAVEFVRYR